MKHEEIRIWFKKMVPWYQKCLCVNLTITSQTLAHYEQWTNLIAMRVKKSRRRLEITDTRLRKQSYPLDFHQFTLTFHNVDTEIIGSRSRPKHMETRLNCSDEIDTYEDDHWYTNDMIKVVSKSAKKDTGIMQIWQHALNLINEDRTEAACEQKLWSIRVQ